MGAAWFFLALAVVTEVAGTSVMKLMMQLDWPIWLGYGLMFSLLAISYFYLAKAARFIPIGMAFACWEALGLVLITVVSVTLLGAELSWVSIMGIGMTVLGIVLLHMDEEHA